MQLTQDALRHWALSHVLSPSVFLLIVFFQQIRSYSRAFQPSRPRGIDGESAARDEYADVRFDDCRAILSEDREIRQQATTMCGRRGIALAWPALTIIGSRPKGSDADYCCAALRSVLGPRPCENRVGGAQLGV